VYVCSDPGFKLWGNGTGYPRNLLVDPRTMKIADIEEGYGGSLDMRVDDLAKKNAR
jgi:hypothetical protein